MKIQLVLKILLVFLISGWLILLLALFTSLDKIIVKPLIVDEPAQKEDVIIVLGSGVDKDLVALNLQAQERVSRGFNLFKEGYAPYLIVSGGLVKKTNYTEADKLSEYAQKEGLAQDKILKESKSRNTYENAIFSQEIMKEKNWQSALVVTSDYHTKRACQIFRKLKMSVKCLAAPVAQDNVYERYEYFRSIVREYGATVYYWLKGYI